MIYIYSSKFFCFVHLLSYKYMHIGVPMIMHTWKPEEGIGSFGWGDRHLWDDCLIM